MKTVFEALYSKLSGSALTAAIGGRWYLIEAPVGSTVPLCVVSIISEFNDHGLQITFVDTLIEISVVADDITSMHTVAELVYTLFDNSTLTGLSGYEQVGPMDRENGQPLIEDGVYRYIIEYRLMLKKL